jgi:sarcosine oxidase subunit delta
MLEIKCPHCGKRSQNEFAYGGDATIKRPKLGEEVSTNDWDDFVYFRDNPRGKHQEFWHHVSGCRQWFKALRDTATHEIFNTAKLEEDL